LQRHVLILSWLISRDRVEPLRAGLPLSAGRGVFFKYGIRTCAGSTEYILVQERQAEDHRAMTTRSQFCPVTKAAEVFGDRWTRIIVRELSFGPRSFGQLLAAAPPISRTVLAQRLKQLEQSGVVHIEPKHSGKGHLYRLTAAGEDFRSIIELLSVWGQ